MLAQLTLNLQAIRVLAAANTFGLASLIFATRRLLAAAALAGLLGLGLVAAAYAQSVSVGGGGLGGLGGGGASASAGGGGGLGGGGSVGGPGGSSGTTGAHIGGGRRSGNVNLGAGGVSLGLGLGGSTTTSNPRGVADALGDMSAGERRKLRKRCASVLAAPRRHDRDLVALCKLIASL